LVARFTTFLVCKKQVSLVYLIFVAKIGLATCFKSGMKQWKPPNDRSGASVGRRSSDVTVDALTSTIYLVAP
jgi:hypothetical protein